MCMQLITQEEEEKWTGRQDRTGQRMNMNMNRNERTKEAFEFDDLDYSDVVVMSAWPVL